MTTQIDELLGDIRALSTPFDGSAALERIVDSARHCRFVAIGEASHGTHEFYRSRAQVTQLLIERNGATWIGVEGDWPDCWRINRWVRGQADGDLDARAVLSRFDRWPTWMWANTDVADFLDWLREYNASRPVESHVGFYGLDVYSLWDSLQLTMDWLAANEPEAMPLAAEALRCFSPFDEDPQKYAWHTRLVPELCEREVVNLLAEVRRRAMTDGDDAFDAMQNAAVAVEAEKYYRAMVRTDRGSWNIRDLHMADTVDRISVHLGQHSRGVLWAHNTHVGDARATTMADAGLLNLGQLLRERHGNDQVFLVGMASYSGEVTAATQWGAAEARMPVPAADEHSHEGLLHRALGEPAVLIFGADRQRPWLALREGHRAIGVIFDPASSHRNYVPTTMGQRYDALVWHEETRALQSIPTLRVSEEDEYETEPTGF